MKERNKEEEEDDDDVDGKRKQAFCVGEWWFEDLKRRYRERETDRSTKKWIKKSLKIFMEFMR